MRATLIISSIYMVIISERKNKEEQSGDYSSFYGADKRLLVLWQKQRNNNENAMSLTEWILNSIYLNLLMTN